MTTINNAPVLDTTKSPALTDVIQNASAPQANSTAGSTLVSDLIGTANNNGIGNYSDIEDDSPGIAITGVSDKGKLYYTTNGGETWSALTGRVSATSALVLQANADTRVYFLPNQQTDAGTINDALTFKAWDGTGGYTNGKTRITTGTVWSIDGSLDTSGAAYGVSVIGNYAYVADGVLGLQVIDISVPNHPTLVGNSDTNGGYGVSVVGNYAYVASGYLGVQIIDISDPAQPTLTSMVDTSGSAKGVSVVGNYAYVADGSYGLQIIDISDPANPTLTGTVDTSGTAVGVSVVGNYAYVADRSYGLQIIDISDPANPTLTGTVDTSKPALGVSVVGNYAYVANAEAGLQIIDISDPANPTLVGNYETYGYAHDVSVVGNYAYVATGSPGVKIIDISDPTKPTLAGTVDTTGEAHGVSVVGDTIYIADSDAGLQVIKATVPNAFSTASDTVSLVVNELNTAPTLTATGTNPTFTELLDLEQDTLQNTPLTYLFTESDFDTIDANQEITQVTITVTNVVDYIDGNPEELLFIGSSAIEPSFIPIFLEDGFNSQNVNWEDTPDLPYSVTIDENNIATVVIDFSDSAEHWEQYLNKLAYINTSQDPTAGDRVVTITSLKDDGGTDNNGQDTTTGLSVSSTVTVVSVNDAPVLDATQSPALADVIQKAGAPEANSIAGSTVVSDLIGTANNNGIGNYSDVEGDSPGIAITGVSDKGTLYYTTDGGANWTALTGTVSATSALVLQANADTRVYFQPNQQTDAGTINDALTFKAWDGTGEFSNGQTEVVTDIVIIESYGVATQGVARSVSVVGNYAYVADGGSGLQVIDISVPNHPTLVGNYDTTGYAYDVSVVGNYAYIADGGGGGLHIIDISNPAQPTLTRMFDTSGFALGVSVVGNYAYVADDSDGLRIIDISDPNNLALTGTFDTSGAAAGVSVVGNYAYVADATSGLQIIDISNPNNPTLAGTIDTTGNARGVSVVGDYAYVADQGSGLQIVDISDPTNPTLAGTVDTPGFAYGVSVVGGYAYVADGSSGLQIIDISDPTKPTLAGTVDTTGEARSVSVVGDTIYIADNDAGLKVIKATVPNAFSTASDTVSLVVNELNIAPTLTAEAATPTFTENGQAVDLFSEVAANTGNTNDAFAGLTLTVTNVADGADEVLNIDGSAISLTATTAAGTTTTNGLTYAVSLDNGTARVTLSGGELTAEQLQTLIDGITYQNNSEKPSTANNRVITLTEVKDSGGTDGNGQNSQALNIAATVNLISINDAPVLDATKSPALADVIQKAGAPEASSIAGSTLVSDLIGTADNNGIGNYSDVEGDSPGIAITGVSDKGTLYYTTDGG
ncbi:Uncharacterized conserved protein, partial [Oceanospirillum multiglobuliferum]